LRDENVRFAGALAFHLPADLAGALVDRLLADFASPFLAFEDFLPRLVVLRAIHHPWSGLLQLRATKSQTHSKAGLSSSAARC
jgi:hypothetical protein